MSSLFQPLSEYIDVLRGVIRPLKTSQNEARKRLGKEKAQRVELFCVFSLWMWSYTWTKHQEMFMPWTCGTSSSVLLLTAAWRAKLILTPKVQRAGTQVMASRVSGGVLEQLQDVLDISESRTLSVSTCKCSENHI